MKKHLVLLIDGSYYIYSVYYAFPNLVNSIGEPTGVIYGMINILRSMLIRYNPEYMVVVFDDKGDTFRDCLFKDYKLYRRPMPEGLCVQVPSVYEIIKAMGIPLIIVPGVEADDVIGTLSMYFSKKIERHVYIFSGDKDMMQLITDNVHVVNTRSNVFFTTNEVKKKFGIFPNLIIDYLSLLGDVSDNIPGVPGIGKVSAKILVKKFGSLDCIYRDLEAVSFCIGLRGAKSISLKLEKYRFLAFLSYKLITIKKDVLLGKIYDDLCMRPMDFDRLVFFFQHYEFKRWLQSLLANEWLR